MLEYWHMKHILRIGITIFVFTAFAFQASAQSFIYPDYLYPDYQYFNNTYYYPDYYTPFNNNSQFTSYTYPRYNDFQYVTPQTYTPSVYYFPISSNLNSSSSSNSNGIDPNVRNLGVDDIDRDSAELNGEVDMNRYNNGIVFFVYGEDKNSVDDVDRKDTYNDIRERGDRLQKVRVDRDLDREERYNQDVKNLDDNTRYYYRICVEYEDNDDDDRIECAPVDDFRTDRSSDSRYNQPDLDTERAQNIQDDRAELNGEVDMNDFDNGRVFFVYGEDRNDVRDVERDYDEYSDIDEKGDDLQKLLVDRDLDSRKSYDIDVRNLNNDTRYYYSICVEYRDGDDTIDCGDIEDFKTDR